MKKIRILFISLLILLFTGCTGDYNLTFNKDLSISEELNIFIENEEDNYDRTYDLFEQAELKEEDYDLAVMDDQIKIIYKKEYNSFTDYYMNSNLYKMLFENINFKLSNTGMNINTESNFKLDDKDNQNIINSYDMDDFRINIKVPFSVKSNNSDLVKDDTYTWILNEDDTYKKISLDFDYKNDSVRNIILLVLVGIVSLLIIGYIVYTILRNRRI